jgi:S-adenosylmethionine hydrolase
MIITLTTDFGVSDSYVAQMKGAILAINAQAQVIDVTHFIPPQNVRRAAAVLQEIAGVFPAASIHVAVVDPGVGTSRALLAAETANQKFLAPDNGTLGPLFRQFPPTKVHRLTAHRFWRAPVSATFHGRDILAPVAAYWSRGTDIAEFGPAVDASKIIGLSLPQVQRVGAMLVGEIESADSFGNLITNVNVSDLEGVNRTLLSVSIATRQIVGICDCYADHPTGTLLALVGSSGRLEIAVHGGSAEKVLGAEPGQEVRIQRLG